MASRRIPDPFTADNEKRVQWVAESDWVYRTGFTCTDELLSEEKVFLVCDGLDTLATVVLNGHELGHTDNMFRRYQWEIKPLLMQRCQRSSLLFASELRGGKASHSSSAGCLWRSGGPTCAKPLSVRLGLGANSPDRYLERYPFEDTAGRTFLKFTRAGTMPDRWQSSPGFCPALG
jgi:hypothetical protein